MTFSRSLIDVGLIARFELLRAARTWRGLALIILYLVATAAGALMFVGLVWALEKTIASVLGVPGTSRPGAMMGELVADESFRQILMAMVGSEDAVDIVIGEPVLAVFHHWFGQRIVPLLAATTAAEAIAGDLKTRALRFELVRTGRLELVTGRFLGQVLLSGIAILLSSVGVWLVGMLAMVGNDPIELAGSLLMFSGRIWLFALPFIGIGLGVSQLTATPAWARILALVATVGSWILLFVAQYVQTTSVPWLGDLILQVLPQGWIPALWQRGFTPWLAGAACAAWGITAMGMGYLLFRRRNQ